MWRPEPTVVVRSIRPEKLVATPLKPKPEAVATWRAAVVGGTANVLPASLGLERTEPAVVSASIEPVSVRTRSVVFADADGQNASQAEAPKDRSSTSQSPRSRRANPSRRTRVRPPREAIRLEDRLACLLQPTLESLMTAESLAFPFEPFDYQMDGVGFLYPRRHAVVADEMGLGKTMQAITTLRLLAKQGEAKRVLLVCPKPLLPNWRRELALWAPELSVVEITGSPERRRWVWANATSVVRLVGYETLVRDHAIAHEDPREYDAVLLDEAQRIKNRHGATHAAVCGLKRRRSWALTGTPIENSIDDLVNLFEFVAPGRVRPGMRPRQIADAVGDAVIRRTKERVLKDLPPKLVRDEIIDLSPAQRTAYQRAEEEGVVRLTSLDDERELTIQHVFELVLRLKQICNFDPATGESSKADQLEAELAECIASGRKAIVFSQWVDTLDRLQTRIQGVGTARYDGRMSTPRREAELQRFRDDPDCTTLLMTYGAGSVGLNLQFAQYVFLFDRWWNPAVEDQAINRAHRIGVAGPVTVTRMLCAGTLEERIDAILREKRELFNDVFPTDSTPASCGLTKQELLSVFRVSRPAA